MLSFSIILTWNLEDENSPENSFIDQLKKKILPLSKAYGIRCKKCIIDDKIVEIFYNNFLPKIKHTLNDYSRFNGVSSKSNEKNKIEKSFKGYTANIENLIKEIVRTHIKYYYLYCGKSDVLSSIFKIKSNEFSEYEGKYANPAIKAITLSNGCTTFQQLYLANFVDIGFKIIEVILGIRNLNPLKLKYIYIGKYYLAYVLENFDSDSKMKIENVSSWPILTFHLSKLIKLFELTKEEIIDDFSKAMEYYANVVAHVCEYAMRRQFDKGWQNRLLKVEK